MPHATRAYNGLRNGFYRTIDWLFIVLQLTGVELAFWVARKFIYLFIFFDLLLSGLKLSFHWLIFGLGKTFDLLRGGFWSGRVWFKAALELIYSTTGFGMTLYWTVLWPWDWLYLSYT